MSGRDANSEAAREAVLGILPITARERRYHFFDAFLILSGYCIATWSYTQGAYLASIVGFKQLVIGAFFAAIFMLVIYQLPVILSVRHGIDIWIWLRAVFGYRGVKIMAIVIIAINFPWYAVCAELFASSMIHLLTLFGVSLPAFFHTPLALTCVFVGTFMAWKGVTTITWATRILVPLLLLVGVAVIVVGFRAVPFETILSYRPADSGFSDPLTAYIVSIEANFAFVITLVGGMAAIPRMAKTERGGFWAGVLGQGLSGSLFVVVGAVMSIAMQAVTGEVTEDPTRMLAVLATPALACGSLLLVAFANIGTQAVGSYSYGVMLKASFPGLDYRLLVSVLSVYVGLLCVWGRITEFFGSFMTISACIYAPLAALLFTDFFFVRRQKLSLRSAFGLPGHKCFPKVHWIGFLCVAAGVALSLSVYNPLTGEVHNMLLFRLTPTGVSFLGTGVLYFLLSRVPGLRRYLLREKMDTTPFDRRRTPPKQNLFFTPLIWFGCWIATRGSRLRIKKERMAGLKPPFLVLGTHHAFMDFLVTPLALAPYRANYVSELEGFEYYGEWLYRQAGCLGTRKFADDMALIQNIKRVIDRNGILVLYPEARYANAGTSSALPASVGKLAKLLDVPLVTVNMHGNYLQSPIWNLKKRRGVPLSADVKQLYTREELRAASLAEINGGIARALAYDEYAWQNENQIRIDAPFRAEGLETVLYQCSLCGAEFQMRAAGASLFCDNCNAAWHMTVLGALEGTTAPLQQIPAWYEWQRAQVHAEIDAGRYRLDAKVQVESLPNAKNFIDLGEGRLTHDANGHALRFQEYGAAEMQTLLLKPSATYSIHTEYDYRGKGQCVTLSVPDNTYFLFPLEKGFNVTKIQFATEYFYQLSVCPNAQGLAIKAITQTMSAN
ncbi:MAG: cytosine permease [Clostridiales bacterium]|jgi:purine-cytosine permease-like protein|nr:cytosine permease [Clostridiales bacterium]